MTGDPYYADDSVTVHHGDCLDVLAELPDASVDAVVTDPPYDLTALSRNGSPRQNNVATPYGRTRLGERGGFMGKTWDGTGVAFNPETWRLVYRVMKPGAHLLAFGGTRTAHRLACAIEDAGFEIRDSIAWLYGSGFPKSLDVAKAIDKATGVRAPGVERTTPLVLGHGPTRAPPSDRPTTPIRTTPKGSVTSTNLPSTASPGPGGARR
jgi:hypothetical protein